MKKFLVFSGMLMLLNACASELGTHQIYRGSKQADSAIAKIYVPADIGVVRVDEKSLFTLLPIKDRTELHVLPGMHKISLRYRAVWDIGREDHTRITSDPVAKWLTVKAGHEYQVEHDTPKSRKSAEAYVPNFDFQIRDLSAPEGAETDVTVGSDAVAASIAAATTGMGDVSTGSTPNTTTKMENRAPDSAIITRKQSNGTARPPLDQLKYWWGQASDAERQGFRQWIERP